MTSRSTCPECRQEDGWHDERCSQFDIEEDSSRRADEAELEREARCEAADVSRDDNFREE